MTLKTGFDTVGTKKEIINWLYTLLDDEGSPLFPENTILTGDAGRFTLYQGRLSFFTIGDLKRIEEGLKRRSRWGKHEAYLWIVVSGETAEAKDGLDEIIRVLGFELRDNPTLSVDGVNLSFADDTPIQRRRVSFDTQNSPPQNWNSSALLKFDLMIADTP